MRNLLGRDLGILLQRVLRGRRLEDLLGVEFRGLGFREV